MRDVQLSSQEYLRNFSIIAHIDHGKSTLADRILERCGALSEREMQAQVLDSMELERERGITIKAQGVSLNYVSRAGVRYQFNIIDTPGHVDFSYEVSRSLAACEGALLVVDASQGVEAQSVANCYSAVEEGLEIIPVLNKMDLPNAQPEQVREQIEDIIGIEASDALLVSAKTGLGIDELLEAVVERIPPPSGDSEACLRALIIDAWFDNYLGVVCLVRIVDGQLSRGDKIRIHSTKRTFRVEEVGVFTPQRQSRECLHTGEVGYILAAVKQTDATPVGDTITHDNRPAELALPGFAPVQPRVFAGLYPISSEQYEGLRVALNKLRLNDAALYFEPESSAALGLGFRCGFLGMLHMEIVQERLEREYNLELISSAASVVYQVLAKGGELVTIHNPADLPSVSSIEEFREPIVETNLLIPKDSVGSAISLCEHKRGVQRSMRYTGGQVSLTYDLPLAEVVTDFFDELKSMTRGYGSFDYTWKGYQKADLVRLDILVNGDQVDALSAIVHRSQAYARGREITENLSKIIPRQMFEVALQAVIGRQVIARATIKAMRKNVTAKCYGGDATRKRKLLEKQKAGKKRMKQIGSVEIPQSAFLAVAGGRSRR